MQLTVHTDYALRVLLRLGIEPGKLVTVDEIAAAYGISRAHLVKVVHRLARLGYVETLRGRRGGVRLALPASQIVIGHVVRDTEESLALVEGFDPGARPCRIAPACGLRGALREAQQAFFEVLDGHTLADLLRGRAPSLARLLDAAPRPGPGSATMARVR